MAELVCVSTGSLLEFSVVSPRALMGVRLARLAPAKGEHVETQAGISKSEPVETHTDEAKFQGRRDRGFQRSPSVPLPLGHGMDTCNK